jgi:hypothetical protein
LSFSFRFAACHIGVTILDVERQSDCEVPILSTARPRRTLHFSVLLRASALRLPWKKQGGFMMCWKWCAAAFVVIIGSTTPAAQALPRWAGPLAETATTSILPIGGCHRDERTHYVPEVRRTLPHVHLGEDCEPYRISDSDGASDDDDDDDADDDVDSNDDDDDSDVCVEIAGVEVCN